MLNPYATPFVPPSETSLARLRRTPFFQQRFVRFLQNTMRDYVGTYEDLQIVLVNPPLQPTTKKTTQFLGVYKQHTVVYEADRMEDPRTGYFRLL